MDCVGGYYLIAYGCYFFFVFIRYNKRVADVKECRDHAVVNRWDLQETLYHFFCQKCSLMCIYLENEL